jgi:hypothetical protein
MEEEEGGRGKIEEKENRRRHDLNVKKGGKQVKLAMK